MGTKLLHMQSSKGVYVIIDMTLITWLIQETRFLTTLQMTHCTSVALAITQSPGTLLVYAVMLVTKALVRMTTSS